MNERRGRRGRRHCSAILGGPLRSIAVAGLALASTLHAQPITAAGGPAHLDVRPAGAHGVRVTLAPNGFGDTVPYSPGVALHAGAPALRLARVDGVVRRTVGALRVEVRAAPLTVSVQRADGSLVQRLTFADDGTLAFALDDAPVLGMGEGGPRPERGANWRTLPIQYDRRGALDTMEPRWQSDAYGSRNPVAMLVGTRGWALYVPTPWGQVDLRDAQRGVLVPWVPAARDAAPQTERNQQLAQGKGLPPARAVVPGVVDAFVFDAREPRTMMADFATVTGRAALPPRWALGYMQSHRTLEDERQLLGIVDTFRAKRLPVDAVIYLGTGFTPRGWNTTQPSFTFNPAVFARGGQAFVSDMHARHARVVLHMVPWDRDHLPTLDAAHAASYWQEHTALMSLGVDAFWPDEGDWFDLFERLARHRMYYEGPLTTRPGVRPWSLHRNGYPGIAQWGGWVWSGDTESSWKTLEGQIAVGLNYALSVGPFWGSDIGGFYPSRELTGELYARWFQFAAFTPSFRGHGRTWWLRLPWGWGLSDMGPREGNNTNTGDSTRGVPASALNDTTIEPIARRYDELRYRLLPYTYTLAWEARATGLPLMRALWLHYPNDATARGLGSEYLWGRDLLVAPVFTQGATTRDVYLPAGDWYDWWTNTRTAGGRTITRSVDLATMPIYVRAGAIVPVDPVRQYTSEPVTEPTTLHVYAGADGAFTLYDDDGASQDYLRGRGSWTRMSWDDRRRRLTLAAGNPPGTTNVVAPREFDVVLHPQNVTKHMRYAGAPVTIAF